MTSDAKLETRFAWLDLFCTGTSDHTTICLKLPDSHVDKISDVQRLLQSEHQIPVCDQQWRYNSQVLGGKETLESLYFRSGDNFEVRYLAAADIQQVDASVQQLKEFYSKLKHTSIDWEFTSQSIETLTFEHFLPWKNAQSVANRHYFYQQGGLDIFFDVFRYVQKNREEMDPSVTDNGTVPMLYYVVVMEMVCLELLWNFSETGPDRQIIMKYGGLDMTLDSLVHSKDKGFIVNGQQLADIAVGCIVQYVEFSDAQLLVVKNVAAMRHLTEMVWSDYGTNLYSCQIAANTLFCCSCLTDTHPYFIDGGICDDIVAGLHQIGVENDMAIRYFTCSLLAQLRASRLCLLDAGKCQFFDSIVKKFLIDDVMPKDVSEWEQSHTYVWVSLLPFLDLAYKSGKRLVSIPKTQWKMLGIPDHALAIGSRTSQAAGLLCVDQLSLTEDNRKLFVSDGLLGYLTCLPWFISDVTLHIQASEVLKRFKVSSPPKLQEIAASCLASHVGLSTVDVLLPKIG